MEEKTYTATGEIVDGGEKIADLSEVSVIIIRNMVGPENPSFKDLPKKFNAKGNIEKGKLTVKPSYFFNKFGEFLNERIGENLGDAEINLKLENSENVTLRGIIYKPSITFKDGPEIQKVNFEAREVI
jgi:hypothetical protein